MLDYDTYRSRYVELQQRPVKRGDKQALAQLHAEIAALQAEWNKAQRDSKPALKVRLYRVYVNSQGYDSSGAYWGIGAPLYYAESEDDTRELNQYLRASDREDAKAKLREEFRAKRNLKFYR